MKLNRFVSALPLLGILFTFLILDGCSREVTIDLDKGFSSQIQQIVPQPILDTLRKRGVVINEGLVPPQLSGIFFLDKCIMQVSYGPEDGKKPGDVFSSYYYRFYGQDAIGNITYDYSTNDKSDSGKGKGSFISGNGNKFTIFSEQTGVSGGISTRDLTVISGEVTEAGILNWQNALILVEKGPDPTNKLIPVTKGRVFKDGDNVAVKGTYFPQSVKPGPGLQLVELRTEPALSAQAANQ